jgi:hypothetical protein
LIWISVLFFSAAFFIFSTPLSYLLIYVFIYTEVSRFRFRVHHTNPSTRITCVHLN